MTTDTAFQKMLARHLLNIAEDSNREVDFRYNFANVIGLLGYKEHGMKILLHFADDDNQNAWLRRSAA